MRKVRKGRRGKSERSSRGQAEVKQRSSRGQGEVKQRWEEGETRQLPYLRNWWSALCVARGLQSSRAEPHRAAGNGVSAPDLRIPMSFPRVAPGGAASPGSSGQLSCGGHRVPP